MRIRGIISLCLLLVAVLLSAAQFPNGNEYAIVFTASPTLGHAPLTVNFDVSSSSTAEGPVIMYEWNFGDGGTGTTMKKTISYTYLHPGAYTAELAASDAEGNYDSSSCTITVSSAIKTPPSANFTATPTSGQTPLAVSFNASGSSDSDGSIVSYIWSFGDGGSSSGVAAHRTYTNAGAYTAELTVTDDGGATDTATQTIQVSAPSVSNNGPTSSFTTSPASEQTPSAVSFNESGSSGSGDRMLPFYLIVGINTFCAIINVFSLGKSQNKKQRVIALLVNSASIATASWNWIVGVALLVLLLGAFLWASVKAYARFEQSSVNASIRFDETSISKTEVMSYARQVRASEKAAKTFNLQQIAEAIAQAASLGVTFGESQVVLPVSMTLSVALSENHDLALQTLVLLARVFATPFTRKQMTDYADKLVVAAQQGLPLQRAKSEVSSFRNTALMNHNRYSVNELLGAMTMLARQGLDDIGAAIGDVYNTIDMRGKRYESLQEAVSDLAEPFLNS